MEPVRNYDLLSISMLCLGGPDGENYNGVLRMLYVLLSGETGQAEKRRILQDDYDIKMTRTMEKGMATGVTNAYPALLEQRSYGHRRQGSIFPTNTVYW